MKKIIVFVIAALLINTGYGQGNVMFTTTDYVRALKNVTDVMVNDVTSPVAASRYYAYINLSANETLVLFDKQQLDFAGFAKAFSKITIDDTLIRQSDSQLAVILALYKSGNRLLPSGYILLKNIDSLLRVAKKRGLTAKKNNVDRCTC